MGHQQLGRTGRRRRQRRSSSRHKVCSGDQQRFVNLLKFLSGRGFTGSNLKLCDFTGRGLQACFSIQSGQLLISLPESCLITTSTVLRSDLGVYIKRWKPRLSAILVLCVFLVFERHRGHDSDWSAYIQLLPQSYTCPAYFSDNVIDLLPANLRQRGLEQRKTLHELHSSSQDFFRSLQPLLKNPAQEVMSYEALRWAWCSVNTRSIFMPQSPSPYLTGEDICVLAPLLDLLNHRPDIQVKAGFNQVTNCYEIVSKSQTPRYHQAFINYGSHDNQRLLLEYGFVASSNPHSVVYVEPEIFHQIIQDDGLIQKMTFLQEHNFLHDLSVSIDGPSWRLMTAVRLLSLPLSHYHQWKAVLRGQEVGAERERWSLRTVQQVIKRLLVESVRVLEEIRSCLLHSSPSERQQLVLIQSLREEEQCILESGLDKLSC
ncbi:SET domain-containing protein 4 isoform X2 [Synchiropus splendidus]|uniref:SET domain-containing protein 4 isoform X2 n=1 Tax=Synchiropus splendidus TaxID=270530 RepID=UPI00237D535F|nr:SET domain-containing protein 4 isoform X2 [Synchiropus splendidus]